MIEISNKSMSELLKKIEDFENEIGNLRSLYNYQREKIENTKIIDWADERGIFEKSNPKKQFLKTQEEVSELETAIKEDDLIGVKDGIGGTVVTLVILAKMYNLTLEECIEYAYNEIKNRKGKMINGIFVKEQ